MNNILTKFNTSILMIALILSGTSVFGQGSITGFTPVAANIGDTVQLFGTEFKDVQNLWLVRFDSATIWQSGDYRNGNEIVPVENLVGSIDTLDIQDYEVVNDTLINFLVTDDASTGRLIVKTATEEIAHNSHRIVIRKENEPDYKVFFYESFDNLPFGGGGQASVQQKFNEGGFDNDNITVEANDMVTFSGAFSHNFPRVNYDIRSHSSALRLSAGAVITFSGINTTSLVEPQLSAGFTGFGGNVTRGPKLEISVDNGNTWSSRGTFVGDIGGAKGWKRKATNVPSVENLMFRFSYPDTEQFGPVGTGGVIDDILIEGILGADILTVRSVDKTSASPGEAVNVRGSNYGELTEVFFTAENDELIQAEFQADPNFPNTRVFAVVPLGAVDGPITLKTADAEVMTESITITTPVPGITSLVTKEVPAGGVAVIEGFNLFDVNKVSILGANTIETEFFEVDASKLLEFVIPANAQTGDSVKIETALGAVVSMDTLIINNDIPLISLELDSNETGEDPDENQQVNLTAVASSPVSEDVTIAIRITGTASPSDYQLIGGDSIKILSGDTRSSDGNNVFRVVVDTDRKEDDDARS